MNRFFCELTLASILISTLAISASAETTLATNPFQSNVHALINDLRIPVEQCPERVWPDYRWMGSNKGVLIVKSDSKQAAFWDLKLDKLIFPKFAELPIQSHSHFGVFEYQGRITLSINITLMSELSPADPWGEGFSFLVHEAFHFFGQESDFWTDNPSEVGRGDFYPALVEPRALRAGVLISLSEQLNQYFSSGQNLPLREAASFYELWQSKYPEETISDIDRLEGSANYVENRSKAIAKVGCQASEVEIARAMKLQPEIYASLDAEAYLLGLLSGVNLDLFGEKEDWKARVNRGEGLADILFEAVPLKDITIDENIERLIAEQLKEKMSQVAPFLDPVVEGLRNKSLVLVSIPYDWNHEGSFSPMGFYQLRDLSNIRTIIYSESYSSWSKNSESKIERRKGSAEIEFHDGCEGASRYVLLPQEELKNEYKKGEVLNYNSDFYRIHALTLYEKKVSGFRLICLEE